jgi:hypothetical protein
MTYGIVNADQIGTSVANTSLGAGDASLMKNRIINGAMTVSQYNGTSSITPSTTNANNFVVDRFTFLASQASKFTLQQNAGSVTPPVGFSNYLGATVSSAFSVGSSDYFNIRQVIEGYNFYDLGFGTANAKTVTLSFWVYSSLTGTFGGSLANYAFSRSYPFTYSIPVANTWTQISITIAGDTGGTWNGATNSGAAVVCFGLGVGSTQSGTAGSWASATYTSATGAVSVVGTGSATWYVTGVQLEVGSIATGFEYRQYQQELALCQRYYWKFISGNQYASYGTGTVITSTNARLIIQNPVTMRVPPTGITSSAASNFYIQAPGNFTPSAVAFSVASTTATQLSLTSSGLTAGYAFQFIDNTAGTSYIDFTGAEL